MTENKGRNSSVAPKIATAAIIVSAILLHLLFSRGVRIVLFLDNMLDYLQGTEEINPYLQGNFAPVESEHRGVPLSVIQGALPSDLLGLFVRNGPNPIPTHVHKKRHHWFDGHGMLHTVRFYGGNTTVTYSNSYIPTPRYAIEKQYNQEIFFKLGQLGGIVGLLKLILLEKLKIKLLRTTRLTSGQANTNALMYQNKFYALHEASLPFRLELRDDGSIEQGLAYERLHNTLNYPVSAHVRVDPLSHNLLFHGYAAHPDLIARDGYLKVGELNTETDKLLYYSGIAPPTRLNQSSQFVVPLAHDMVFTKHWMIVYDGSVVFDGTEMAWGGEFLKFHTERNLMIGLVPRNTTKTSAGSTRWFDVGAPHVAVHPLNAWEEDDGSIVIWLPLGDAFHGDLQKGLNTFYMTELRLNPQTGNVVKTSIDRTYNVEFSRLRDDCMGEFAQFGVTAYVEPDRGHVEGMFHGFVVWDMKNRSVHEVVQYPNGALGGEAVVIPKPGTLHSSGEVYVAAFLYEEQDAKSTFVLYDMESTLQEPAVTLLIPHRVPHGFHGCWVDDIELQNHIAYHTTRRTA